MRLSHLAAWLVAGVAAGVAAPMPAARAEPVAAIAGPITVIDADTIEAGGRRWRLDGIDAPEIATARCGGERERGIRAAARLIEALTQRGGGVVVPTRSRSGRVASGGFGRSLGRLVFADGATWDAVAMAEGHAVAWAYRKAARPDWCSVAGS